MKALIRRPSPRLAEGLITHLERTPVDAKLAQAQWDGYVSALQGNGWDTVEVNPAPDCPDSAFVEDAVVVYERTAVIARPGAVERAPETPATEAAVAALGYTVIRIQAPGTLDGGDVLKVGQTVYVGNGGRTNGEGIRQLRAILTPLGARVIGVPMTKALHLKSAVTALPDGTVIGYPPIVEDPSIFPHFLPMPDEGGAHVVLLGEDRLLMASSSPASAERLASLGWRPVIVDIGEFEKLEGCVTCLSVRLRGLG